MSAKESNLLCFDNDFWINPTGGFGDILILSGVLKQCNDLNPQVKFNLVRRAIYTDFFKGHPAISRLGFPPKNSKIVTTDYWAKEKLGIGNQRPYQILSRLFGLKTPVEEILFLPEKNQGGELLPDFLPTGKNKIAVIAPSSVSPRKMMEPKIWRTLVGELINNEIFVIQVGRKEDIYIKGSYSLLGLTTPHQLVYLLTKADVIITVDNFIMHAAHLLRKPAIVIWGPTKSKVYGYSEQIHFQCSTKHCSLRNKCLGPDFPNNYKTPCPMVLNHCLNNISTDKITKKVIDICFK